MEVQIVNKLSHELPDKKLKIPIEMTGAVQSKHTDSFN